MNNTITTLTVDGIYFIFSTERDKSLNDSKHQPAPLLKGVGNILSCKKKPQSCNSLVWGLCIRASDPSRYQSTGLVESHPPLLTSNYLTIPLLITDIHTFIRLQDYLKLSACSSGVVVHHRAVRQGSLWSPHVNYVLFHWRASVKMHHVQCTPWTLQFSHSCHRNAPFFLWVPNSTKRSWHFPPASTQLPLDFNYFFLFKASFQVLCPAGSESVATRHGPWHQDSAARQTGQGTVQSAGTQPHLCMEITVGLSASHPSFLCNWESFSALDDDVRPDMLC